MYLWECKYLKSIADTSMIDCDEAINVMDIASTKKDKYYSNKKDKCYEYCLNKVS